MIPQSSLKYASFSLSLSHQSTTHTRTLALFHKKEYTLFLFRNTNLLWEENTQNFSYVLQIWDTAGQERTYFISFQDLVQWVIIPFLLWWKFAIDTETDTLTFTSWFNWAVLLIKGYHSLAPMYYRGAQAAIVVYDITSKVFSHYSHCSWLIKKEEPLCDINIQLLSVLFVCVCVCVLVRIHSNGLKRGWKNCNDREHPISSSLSQATN
jgi:GTPase SAR1 family protein